MRRPSGPVVLACLGLVLAACSGGEERAIDPSRPTSTGPTTTTLADIGPVSGCEGLGPAPIGGEVTYVSGQRLFAVVPGGAPRCLLGVPPFGAAPAWGGKADRVLLAPEGAQVGDKTFPLGLVREESAGWSQPTGTSVLILRDGKLTKRRIDTGAFSDVSFLSRHDEAVYHPAGLHIVSVGVDAGDRYGMFLASNEGKDLEPVAVAETANHLVSPSWGHGGTLFFGAEHAGNPPGDRNHIHYRFNDPGELFKIPLGDGPVGKVLASPFDDLVASETGSCPGRDTQTVDLGQATSFTDDVPDVPVVTVDVGAAETEPVGWLPDGRLVVLGRPDCQGPGTLWIVPVSPAGDPQHLADGVESAAVRVPLPEPGAAPFEAGGVQEVEA
ncbi:MAG: hypothetical protein ACRD0C_24630 [Acidimicrobiia bacterium]